MDALGERAFAFPGTELQLALEQQPDVGDRLDVGGEAGVCLPGAVGGSVEPCCRGWSARQTAAGRRRACALCPAGVAPAVAQAARGPMGAADQSGELVEGDRVLLRDQPQQLDVSFRDLEAASVSPPTPLALSHSRSSLPVSSPSSDSWLIVVLLICLFCRVLVPAPARSSGASLPWFVTSRSADAEGGEREVTNATPKAPRTGATSNRLR